MPRPRSLKTQMPNRFRGLGLASLSGLTLLVVLAGCAQFNKFKGEVVGEGFGAAQSAPTAQEPGETQSPPAAPEMKPVAKPAHDAGRDSAVTEAHTPPPEAPQAKPAVPAAGAAQEKAMEPDVKKAEPAKVDVEKDTAVVEKEPTPKEKKAHAAKAKKSKKPAASKPQTEDAFLPPIPLPSRPPAIGGSGG